MLRMLILLYNFMSVYTNIPTCRRDESKTSFPLQEGIFVYSRVLVQSHTYILISKTITYQFIHQIFKSIISSTLNRVLLIFEQFRSKAAKS